MPPVQLREVEEDVDAAYEKIRAGNHVHPVTDAHVI
jgi:hypothetical protein